MLVSMGWVHSRELVEQPRSVTFGLVALPVQMEFPVFSGSGVFTVAYETIGGSGYASGGNGTFTQNGGTHIIY